jgi:hypothetical protein
MNRPGSRLRTFAARWCRAGTMTRIVDPLIADLQREHADAVRSGRVWNSRWIQLAGWMAFVKVVIICAAATLISLEDWTSGERKSLARAAAISTVSGLALTVLLVSRAAEDIPAVLVHPSPTRLLFLAPYPFVAGIVLGTTLGIVLGWGGHALSRRLVAAAVAAALICSAIVFVDVGWVAPAAHVGYLTRIGYSDPKPEIGEASLGAPSPENRAGQSRFGRSALWIQHCAFVCLSPAGGAVFCAAGLHAVRARGDRMPSPAMAARNRGVCCVPRLRLAGPERHAMEPTPVEPSRAGVRNRVAPERHDCDAGCGLGTLRCAPAGDSPPPRGLTQRSRLKNGVVLHRKRFHRQKPRKTAFGVTRTAATTRKWRAATPTRTPRHENLVLQRRYGLCEAKIRANYADTGRRSRKWRAAMPGGTP